MSARFPLSALMSVRTFSSSAASAAISSRSCKTVSSACFALFSLSVVSMLTSDMRDEISASVSSAAAISAVRSSRCALSPAILDRMRSRFAFACSICFSCDSRPEFCVRREPPVISPPRAYISPSSVTILNPWLYFLYSRSAVAMPSTTTVVPSSVCTKG